MKTRTAVLVAAFLWAIGTPPAFGQDEIPLRAIYQGDFLPEGTQLIVITRGARVEKSGRYQPEFLPASRYPTYGPDGIRRDRLVDAGRSARRYPTTESSGHVYFLYALTPDSTLYWSFSAERDSLKFDVVSTGVMSVAPVPDPGATRDVLRSFFRERVIVHMPEVAPDDSLQGETDASGRPPSMRTMLGEEDEIVRVDGEGSANLDEPESVESESAAPVARLAMPPDMDAQPGGNTSSTEVVETHRPAGSRFGTVGMGVLLLLAGAAGGAVVAARKHRKEVRSLEREIDKLRRTIRRVGEITGEMPLR